MYQIIYSKQARVDAKKLTGTGLKDSVSALLTIVATNPYQDPPPYKKLWGNFQGAFSRRINYQHRLVYQIVERTKTIRMIRMWSHYE